MFEQENKMLIKETARYPIKYIIKNKKSNLNYLKTCYYKLNKKVKLI